MILSEDAPCALVNFDDKPEINYYSVKYADPKTGDIVEGVIAPRNITKEQLILASACRVNHRFPTLVYISRSGNQIWRCSELKQAGNSKISLEQEADAMILNSLTEKSNLVIYTAREGIEDQN